MMSRTLLISIAITIFVVSAGIIAWSFFGFGKTALKTNTSAPVVKQASSSAQPAITARLPVSLTNSGVRSTKVLYTFALTVKDIKQTTSGKELTATNKSLPVFVINSGTEILFSNNGIDSKALSQDLKVGQRLIAVTDYDFEKKIWTTTKVKITTPSATSSASPK